MLHQNAHGGIEAVAILELEGQTFGQVAGADAGRIEGLQDRQHGLHVAQRRAELVGDILQVAGQVAGLVHHIDQILPDHAAGRIGNGQGHLLGEMIAKRGLGGDESFQIVAAVLAARGGARPFRISAGLHFRLCGFFAAVVGKHVAKFGAEPLFHGGAAGFQVVVIPVGGTDTGSIGGIGGIGGFGIAAVDGRLVVVAGALQKRIALKLAFDVGRKVKA